MSRHFARLYDCVMRIAERGRLAEWRRDLVWPVEGRVLEIAAGTGLDFPHYRAGVTVIATDPDWGMVQRARVRAERAVATILLVAADAEALPFRAGSFDTCVVALGLCTIPSPPRALAEVGRVLRPGGTARLLEHVRIQRPIIGWLQDVLTPLWRRVAGGCRLNERSLESVRRAGLRIDESRSHMGGYVIAITASTADDEPGMRDGSVNGHTVRRPVQGRRTRLAPRSPRYGGDANSGDSPDTRSGAPLTLCQDRKV